jgi:acylphosphatase
MPVDVAGIRAAPLQEFRKGAKLATDLNVVRGIKIVARGGDLMCRLRRGRCATAAAVLLSGLFIGAPAHAKIKSPIATAVSGTVSGNVQQVGFRAMILKQAIANNLAGSAKNNDDGTVQFSLQGDSNRIDQAVAAITNGTKKSSDVKITTSPSTVDPALKTFTVIGWNSKSRGIDNHYDLVFSLRADNTTIKKKAAQAVWLGICNASVKGEDVGKCNKGKDADD